MFAACQQLWHSAPCMNGIGKGLGLFSRGLMVAIALFTAGVFQSQALSASAHEARHSALHYQGQASDSPSLNEGDCGICIAHRSSTTDFPIVDGAELDHLSWSTAEVLPLFIPVSIDRFFVSARGPPLL